MALLTGSNRKNIAVFISGTGSNLKSLIKFSNGFIKKEYQIKKCLKLSIWYWFLFNH